MSKAVMLSIKPKYCDLIASGKKTLEVRKTKPIIETPFKCYIYCTKADLHSCLMFNRRETKLIKCCNYKTAIPVGGKIANGYVIGEFICDTYVTDRTYGHDTMFKAAACMDDIDTAVYCTNPKVYGWHISELKIYDMPKDLSEFYKACNKADFYDCSRCEDKGEKVCYAIERPPQSWCYVEEVEI